jgi:glutathione S-transferase
MLIIHHLGVSQSERIHWLCEELGIPYELKIYSRDSVTRMAPAAYKALHPMGIAPVIDDGELRLAESGAIIEYIIQKYGDGRLAVPPSSPDYARYLFWFHFANATLMPAEMTGILGLMLGADMSGPVAQLLNQRSGLAMAMLEQRLSEAPYLAGQDFTAADLINFFPLTTLRHFVPKDLAAFPNIRAYLQRVGARPAYRKAMALGDPGLPLLLE